MMEEGAVEVVLDENSREGAEETLGLVLEVEEEQGQLLPSF
jgi:predicted RNase H-like HicB family nuclease